MKLITLDVADRLHMLWLGEEGHLPTVKELCQGGGPLPVYTEHLVNSALESALREGKASFVYDEKGKEGPDMVRVSGDWFLSATKNKKLTWIAAKFNTWNEM